MAWKLLQIVSFGMLILLEVGCSTGNYANQVHGNPYWIEFTFKNDTLFAPNGGSIYVGKRLTVGKGSGEYGRYQAISFKSPAAFPLLFLRKSEIENDPEYKVNPSARDDDKVKAYLAPGQSLTVAKINSKGNNTVWHYYEVLLVDGSNKFRCDIGSALALKELVTER